MEGGFRQSLKLPGMSALFAKAAPQEVVGGADASTPPTNDALAKF